MKVVFGKNSYYYHADGLGTVVALDDSAGKMVQSYQYDSFGNVLNRVKQPFAFTGREWDKETGLYYYRARYYDPMEGRFISKDPIGFRGRDVNLYGYVHNNPINRRDPRGLFDDLPTPGADQDPDSYNPMDPAQAWAAEQNAKAAAARAKTANFCKKAEQAVTNTLNSQLGNIDEAYPPGTTTGHPVTDTALAGYSIFKWVWNGIFN